MKSIDIVLYREGRHWVAQALNVNMCSFGETRDAARVAFKESLELYFEYEPDAEMVEVAEAQAEEIIVEAV